MKLEKFISIARHGNIFGLYELENNEEEKMYEECVEKIVTLIYKFAAEYRKIAKKYRNLGVGDTETDETVVHQIYKLIHWTHRYDIEI